MESKIVKALKLKCDPVAIVWKDEKQNNFKEGRWGCVMWIRTVISRIKTFSFDRVNLSFKKQCGNDIIKWTKLLRYVEV